MCIQMHIYRYMWVYMYIHMHIRERPCIYIYMYIYENGLICLYPKFQKRKGKLLTYTYAVNAKANRVLNWDVKYSFVGVSSNHRIVTAKIRLSRSWNTAYITSTIHYAWPLLNNEDVCDKYNITLRNKFEALLEITEILTPDDEYENFVNDYTEAATEYIPNKVRTKHRVTLETLVVKKNKKAWKRHPYVIKGTQLMPTPKKLEKAQTELINVYQKGKIEYIQRQIYKKEERQSSIEC